jgi:hypothetical protein
MLLSFDQFALATTLLTFVKAMCLEKLSALVVICAQPFLRLKRLHLVDLIFKHTLLAPRILQIEPTQGSDWHLCLRLCLLISTLLASLSLYRSSLCSRPVIIQEHDLEILQVRVTKLFSGTC